MVSDLNKKFYDGQSGPDKKPVKSALSDQSVAVNINNANRNSLFRSDNEAIRKQIGSNKFVW